MNTQELQTILDNNIHTRRLGTCRVVARDQLPASIDMTKTAGFILNTDPSFRPGEHWTALFYNGLGTWEFFDSFGLPPRHREVINFIERHSKRPWSYNTYMLQQLLSSTCGLYAVYFLITKARGGTLHTVLRHFRSNKQWLNDRTVTRLVLET